MLGLSPGGANAPPMTKEHTCGECGESFASASALGAHKTYKHSDNYDAEYKDPDTLRELYHGEDLSTIEIADRFDVSSSTIQKYMKRGGVERQKAYNDPTRPPRHYFDERAESVGNSYEKIQPYFDGDRPVVYVHRLVAYAREMLDFEELCDPTIEVHHKNGHGLDNRPKNLEVKSRVKHATDHTDERYGGGGWRDKERMKDLLEETTQKEAAEILGCSKRTIYVWKNKHGLE